MPTNTKVLLEKRMQIFLEHCKFKRHLYEGETPHSFRHGGTVNSLKQGRSLEKTMYLAYMKNVKTAQSYSRGMRVFFPNFNWKEAGVSDNPESMDELDLMCQMKSWKAFCFFWTYFVNNHYNYITLLIMLILILY